MPGVQSPPQTGKNGQPDPTANVLALVDAAVKRLDDLRVADSERIKEIANLRSNFQEKLAEAEAKRIDAIRAVDVNAVAVASERAAVQATVLATQVAQSAETLRTLVASTAATVATQLSQMSTQLTDRLALLEKAQYEGKGKEAVSDPIMRDLLIEMKAMRSTAAESTGKSTGINASWGILLGAIALIGTLYSILKG